MRRQNIDHYTRSIQRNKEKIKYYTDGGKFKPSHYPDFTRCPKCRTEYEQKSGLTKSGYERLNDGY